jgi:cytochrome c-type biogenesis protein CcmH/NrfG
MAGSIHQAESWLSAGKIDAAITELRLLVADDPSLAQAHYFLGTALLQHKEKAQAQAQSQFQEALKISPDMLEALRALAELNLAEQNTQLARDYAQHALRLSPDEPASHLLLAGGPLRELLASHKLLRPGGIGVQA